MMSHHQSAADIIQRSLDETGRAMVTGDFDRMAGWFWLPTSIITQTGMRILKTREDLKETFESVRAHHATQGVTHIQRDVDAALFDGPDIVRCSYSTRIYTGDKLLKGPFPNYSVMQKRNGEWRIADSQYVVRGSSKLGAALLAAGEEGVVAKDENDPISAVFHNALHEITQGYLTADFDRLLSYMQLPIFFQGESGTEVLSTRDDLHEDFNQYMTEFSIHGVTDIVRMVKRVERNDCNGMLGHYRSYVLRGDHLIIPAYDSSITLEQGQDLHWRATTVMQNMGHLTIGRILDPVTVDA